MSHKLFNTEVVFIVHLVSVSHVFWYRACGKSKLLKKCKSESWKQNKIRVFVAWLFTSNWRATNVGTWSCGPFIITGLSSFTESCSEPNLLLDPPFSTHTGLSSESFLKDSNLIQLQSTVKVLIFEIRSLMLLP